MSCFLVAFVAQRLVATLFVVRAKARHEVHGCAVDAPEGTTLAMTYGKRVSFLIVAVMNNKKRRKLYTNVYRSGAPKQG